MFRDTGLQHALRQSSINRQSSTKVIAWPCWGLLCLCLATLLSSCGTPKTESAASSHERWLKAWRAANPTWRGVHLDLHNDQQAAQLEEALPKLRDVGVNVVIVEVDYAFQFQSHPELCAKPGLSRQAAQSLVHTARAWGIRIIPQLNCLGHQSWASHTAPLLTQYPNFDETPGQFPDNQGIYCRSWCPQNPDVNRVVFALIDELSDAFDADAFHVGMDEVFIIASKYCPRCHGADPAKLFAKCVNDLHAHIVGRRKEEMLMWGDRLLPAKTLGYSEWEAAKNGTEGAAGHIPKDIILCDWHYEKRADYPSVPYLLKKGFRVWPSGWQPLDASLAFSQFARRQTDHRLVGYLCTTWGKTSIPHAPEWPPIKDALAVWTESSAPAAPGPTAASSAGAGRQ